MSKQTKIIIASLAALLVIVLLVLFYFVFFGAMVECGYCDEKYFEKQGKVVPIFGVMCPDCYAQLEEEFGGDDEDDDDDDNDNDDNQNNSSTHVHTEVIDAEVDATCTETGLTEGKHCSDCGKIIKGQNVIPMKPHTYDNDDDTTCNVCGFDKIRDCKHDNPQQIQVVAAKAPSCIETGLTEGKQCNICGTMIVPQVVIPIDADNHTTVVCEAISPTCQKTGLTEGERCVLCGKTTIEQDVIPKKDCAFFESEEIVDVQATKTQDGKSHTECEICGKVLNEYIHGAGSQGLKYQYNSDNTYTVVGIGSCTDKELVIPKTHYNLPVTSIANDAFSDCNIITSVVIPDGITSIGDESFEFCGSLKTVVLPDTLISIGNYAFYECSSLTSISIPDSVTNIGGGIFYNCISLSEVNLGNGITELKSCEGLFGYYGMFENCYSLKNITIPISVKRIDAYTFYGVYLENIYFSGTIEQWNAIDKEDSLCNTYYIVHCSNGTFTE